MSDLKRRFIGAIERKVLSGLTGRVGDLDAKQRFAYDLATAQADMNYGSEPSVERALEILKRLQGQSPRDARILEAMGLAYMRVGRNEQANEIWRRLISGLPKKSAGWYRAKLNLAMSLRRAGQTTQARQVIELLEILYPELGGPTFRKHFLAEKRRLSGS